MCSLTEYTPELFLVHPRSCSTPFKTTTNPKKVGYVLRYKIRPVLLCRFLTTPQFKDNLHISSPSFSTKMVH